MRSTRIALALGMLLACGGQTAPGGSGADGGASSGGGSGGGSSGSSSGGGSGGGSGGQVLCPPQPPAGGGACPRQGLQCEYGDDPQPQCNDVESCTSKGWSGPHPGPVCPAGTCPATYPGGSSTLACAPQQSIDCSYAEGQCNCFRDITQDPSAPPQWHCFVPAAGCPLPRAPLGSSCAQEGLECDYGACENGIAEQCTGGVWVEPDTACPL